MLHPAILVSIATTLFTAWGLLGLVDAQPLPEIRSKIPNGYRVKSPCVPIFLAREVGHEDPFAFGPRNQFGHDFADAGLNWTTSLCQKDSDGDGMINGQELGDPDCTWAPGGQPARTNRITHPGVDNFNPDCLRRFIRFLLDSRPRPPRPTPPTTTTSSNTTTTNSTSTALPPAQNTTSNSTWV